MINPFSLSIGTTMVGHFIFAGKIVGATVTIGGLFYRPTKRILAGVNKVSTMSDNMDRILTNHLPHIQTALDASTEQMAGLKSDVRDLGTQVSGLSDRIEDTNTTIHTLSTSFIGHLENMSVEKKPKKSPGRKRAVRV